MAHTAVGEGHMKISNYDGTYSKVHAWYATTMTTIVLSPGELVQRYRNLYKSNAIYYDEDEQTGYVKFHCRKAANGKGDTCGDT
eukprot:15337755-Ditylum_brightwellii.AAC.1